MYCLTISNNGTSIVQERRSIFISKEEEDITLDNLPLTDQLTIIPVYSDATTIELHRTKEEPTFISVSNGNDYNNSISVISYSLFVFFFCFFF